jgi:hypothetical protein
VSADAVQSTLLQLRPYQSDLIAAARAAEVT